MMTERDRQVEWIKSATGDQAKAFNAIKIDYLDRNRALVFADMIVRNRDGYEDDFLDPWVKGWNGAIIETIDWSQLNNCKQCGGYFDPEYPETEFCSEDCADVFMGYQDK